MIDTFVANGRECVKMPFEALRAASGCARSPGLIIVIPGCPVVSVSWTTRLSKAQTSVATSL